MTTTTLATCWKLTRRDATVEGFTDHDSDIVTDGVTYKSAVGFVPSSVERNTDLTANNQQLIGIIDATDLDRDDLRNGAYTGARVVIFTVDWTSPASGPVSILLVGHLGDMQIDGDQYTAELLSLENELAKPALRTFSLRCDADLGDSRCGYSLSADTGTVTAQITTGRVFTDTSRSEADDYYNGGKVTFTSGANNGRSMDVKKYTLATGRVELYEPLPDTIAGGDTYSITRGCDKTFETCKDVFSNAVNFRGFPHVPGVSDLVSGET